MAFVPLSFFETAPGLQLMAGLRPPQHRDGPEIEGALPPVNELIAAGVGFESYDPVPEFDAGEPITPSEQGGLAVVRVQRASATGVRTRRVVVLDIGQGEHALHVLAQTPDGTAAAAVAQPEPESQVPGAEGEIEASSRGRLQPGGSEAEYVSNSAQASSTQAAVDAYLARVAEVRAQAKQSSSTKPTETKPAPTYTPPPAQPSAPPPNEPGEIPPQGAFGSTYEDWERYYNEQNFDPDYEYWEPPV